MWTNRNQRFGKNHVEILRSAAETTFGIDIDALAGDRNHQFWVLGIDEKENCYRDLIGNIDADSMKAFNRNFFITDAGFQSSVQLKLPALRQAADVYLINTAHIEKSRFSIAPIIIHELAHYLEQIGKDASYPIEPIDVTNGQVVLDSFSSNVLKLHSTAWAQLLCSAARFEVASGRYTSIRSFLELAVPIYDRPNWQGELIKEMST